MYWSLNILMGDRPWSLTDHSHVGCWSLAPVQSPPTVMQHFQPMLFCAKTCRASWWCNVKGKTMQGNEQCLQCFYHKHRSMKQREPQHSSFNVNKKHLSWSLQHLHVRGQMAPGPVQCEVTKVTELNWKHNRLNWTHKNMTAVSLCVSQPGSVGVVCY